jgi:hypothetical protein
VILLEDMCFAYGTTCYENSCPAYTSSGDSIDKICSLLECGQREPVSQRCSVSDADMCAYLEDVNSSVGVCATCPSLLFENVGGVCVLKTCLARSVNNSAALVCGSEDCVYNRTGCNTECEPFSTVGERGFIL